jgi:hypothetical protein
MLNETEIQELFNLPVEKRKELVEQGVDLLLMEVGLLSVRTEQTFQKVINDIMYRVDLNKQKALELEIYELVWYYEELTWGVQDKLAKMKKDV